VEVHRCGAGALSPSVGLLLCLARPVPAVAGGGSWGILEKRFCALGWGLPLIFMILIYTVPAVEANVSRIAVYIPDLGV